MKLRARPSQLPLGFHEADHGATEVREHGGDALGPDGPVEEALPAPDRLLQPSLCFLALVARARDQALNESEPGHQGAGEVAGSDGFEYGGPYLLSCSLRMSAAGEGFGPR
jgi:hypothetical protein